VSQRLTASLAAGVDYLLARQAADGHFEDYRLPVGRSDQWITAVAGATLAGVGHRFARTEVARAARRAADWLLCARSYPAGWGFNGITGPDADSTAWTLHLLAAVDVPARASDVEWLLGQHRHGGFATYDRDDGWGRPHPDVTPLAFLALPSSARDAIAAAVTAFSRDACVDGRWWPAYWWRNCHYSTYWNLRLARELGWDGLAPPPCVSDAPPHAVSSCFDLAHLVGIAHIGCRAPDLASDLADQLCSHQRSDGSWPGSDDLRVTDPRLREPWREALDDDRSARFVDVESILTTASVVAILSECG
jgi:hypothetical protein